MEKRVTSRQFEQQQRLTLERLKARIPAGCPLLVERRPSQDAWRDYSGFVARGPGCEMSGRAQVVAAFIDGYVACWGPAREHLIDVGGKLQYLINWVNAQGLLPEGVFTFPDGDSWEAKR